MLPIKQMLLTKDPKKGGRPGKIIIPKALVIHWTANTGKGSDADNTRNYFESAKRQAAAHYIVDDHQVIQCVPENEMAYHVGANRYPVAIKTAVSTYPNNATIGIEMCVNEDGDFWQMYHNTVVLAGDICKRHGWGLDHLYRHFDITGKDCPRYFMNDEAAKQYGIPGGALAGWNKFKQDVGRALRGEVK